MQESVTFNNAFFKGAVLLDNVNNTAWFLVPDEPKILYGCIYMGSVQYLSHEERVKIIQSDGEDFDILPKDFDGPTYKEVHSTKYLSQSELGLTLIREWDGTIDVVKVKDESIIYPDGTIHQCSRRYIEQLNNAVFTEMKKSPESGYW